MLLLISILIVLFVPLINWWFGFWNNMLTMINCLLAALIATSAYPAISEFVVNLDKDENSYAYVGDFVGLWAIFVISFMLLRGFTDSLSKYRLKFDIITEMTGRTVFSIGTAIVLLCFTNFTLQLAPLDQELFSESGKPASITDAADSSLPDQMWVGYAQYASTGPLSSGSEIPDTFYEAAKQYRYSNQAFKDERAEKEMKK